MSPVEESESCLQPTMQHVLLSLLHFGALRQLLVGKTNHLQSFGIMLDLANDSCSNVEQAESLTELLSISNFFHINFLNFLKSTF